MGLLTLVGALPLPQAATQGTCILSSRYEYIASWELVAHAPTLGMLRCGPQPPLFPRASDEGRLELSCRATIHVHVWEIGSSGSLLEGGVVAPTRRAAL